MLGGPFAGLVYTQDGFGSAVPPKILGCYECELHDEVERLIAQSPRFIVDVGAAEGYYVCGFGKRLPEAKLVAFEAEAQGRERCFANVRLNELEDRVDIRGFCGVHDLQRVLCENSTGKGLLVMDVEGGEAELLLNNETMNMLGGWHVLCETHEFAAPGVEGRLVEAYSASHQCVVVRTRKRRLSDMPRTLGLWWRWVFFYLVREGRKTSQSWLVMSPRRNGVCRHV